MSQTIKPDIMARLYLYPPEMSGRKSDTPETFYSFRLKIGSSFHDARALLKEHGPLAPGDLANVLVKFLDSETVMKKINVGDVLPIWELNEVGQLEVLDLISTHD